MRTFLIAVSGSLALIALPSHAASFNCAKAKSLDEKAICSHRTLSDADVKVATLFEVDSRLVAMGQRGDIGDAQRDWLASRKLCTSNIKCLTASYDKRIQDLQKAFDAIASRGPF